MTDPSKKQKDTEKAVAPDAEGASEHLRNAMQLSRQRAMTWTFVHVIVPWFVLLAATLAAWGAWRDVAPAPSAPDPRIDEVLEVVKRNQGKIMMLQQELRDRPPHQPHHREEK